MPDPSCAADYPGISALFGRLISGLLRSRHLVGGSTFAGRVVEVGAQVTRFQCGDDVYGSMMFGAYGQYLAKLLPPCLQVSAMQRPRPSPTAAGRR